MYIVYQDVWESADLALDDLVCLDCLQERLNEPLKPEDFVWTQDELTERLAMAARGEWEELKKDNRSWNREGT